MTSQISQTMDRSQMLRLEEQVNNINKTIREQNGRETTQEMGKDDFMKILITQLQNQDPTAPMEDKEFIAQMAQFSSLEQMNNLAAGFSQMSAMFDASNAQGLLGKTVEITQGDRLITGSVDAVSRGEYPQLLINGQYYDYSQVVTVLAEGDQL